MPYQYKIIQVPSSVIMSSRQQDALAKNIEAIINQYATAGWEFHRMDHFTIYVAPGCLAGLFGAQPTPKPEYLISFRRPY